VGLKPTYGRVSRYGVFALAESMDHIGPMTRTVEDAALMFEAMAGFDPNDPTSLAEPVPHVSAELTRGIEGLRVGFDRRYATNNVEPDVAAALGDVLGELTRLGAVVVNVTMPDVSEVGQAWYDLCAVEAVAANTKTFPTRADEYGPGFRSALEYGLRVTGLAYALASKLRAEFTGRLNRMLADVDCFVCPSMANAAHVKSVDPTVDTEGEWSRLVMNDIHTKPFDFSGSPTLSVPCGFTSDGLPLSVQFVGSRLSESVLCRVGHAFQQATRWHTKHPDVGSLAKLG
jgi:amidase